MLSALQPFRLKMPQRGVRQRWAGPNAQLSHVLGQQVDSKGRSFIRYSEERTTSYAKVEHARLEEFSNGLKLLHALEPSLVFSKGSLYKACELVLEEKRDTLKLQAEHEKDWAVAMSSRLHNALSHIAKALRDKKKLATDLRGLPGVEAPPKAAAPWTFGWCPENLLAYRSRKRGARELSEPITKPECANPEDPVRATFKDGSVCEVRGLTWSSWEAKAKATKPAASSKPKIDIMWEKEHVITHNKVVVKQRTDRCQLLAVYDQNRQVLQVCLKWFGNLPLPQPEMVPADNPALKKAFDFVLPLAEMWQSDAVKTKADLLALRDERLASLRIDTKNKAQKRKASPKQEELASPSKTDAAEPKMKNPREEAEQQHPEGEHAELFEEPPVFLDETEAAALESLQ